MYRSIAKAWTKVAPENRDQHIFATVDFEEGGDVFRKV